MANIDEAFAALSDVQSVSVNENVDFVVDSYLRVISIPVRGVVLGVEGDKDVNRVTFRMSRTYKGVDMSQFQIRINYANANNELNYFKVTEITVSDDEIVFVWVVGADAVAYVGNVEFVVRFIKLSGSNIIQELNTTLATAKSLIGLSVDGEISPVQREDLLAHFYNEIDAYSETKKNEILDSIPEDYTALANEVDELKGDLDEIAETVYPKNKLNQSDEDFLTGSAIHRLNGSILTGDSYANYWTSGFIPVKEGQITKISHLENGVLKQDNIFAICNFDSDKNATNNGTNNVSTYTIPSGTSYIRVSAASVSKLPNVMVEVVNSEEEFVVDYTEYFTPHIIIKDIPNRIDNLENGLEENKGNLVAIKDMMQIKKSENMVNPETIMTNTYINNSNGKTGNSDIFDCSDFIEVNPNVQIRTTVSSNMQIYEYLEDKTYSGNYSTTFNKSNPYTLSSATKYVRVVFYKSQYPLMIYQKNSELLYEPYGERSESYRNKVLIFNTDSEEEIFLKMLGAYRNQNCDVYFERGVYEFRDIFELMKTKYGRNTAYELPIGGNCRYYFNGSVLRAFATSTDTNVLGNESLLGSWRDSGNYELYDGILETTGMVYTVHDEASGSLIPYVRKYHNIRMKYIADISKRESGMCLGGGTGCYGSVALDNCVLETDANTTLDGGFHGHTTQNPTVESTFYLTVSNCYFSKRFLTGTLAENETAELVFNNNMVKNIPTSGNGWNVKAWNNEVHE